MRILDHTHVMHIACKWSNYPSNPFFTGFYLENRLPVAIRKAAKNLQRNFLEPNSIPLSHYFCSVRLDLRYQDFLYLFCRPILQCGIIKYQSSALWSRVGLFLLMPFVTFLHKKEYWWWQENHEAKLWLLRDFFWSKAAGRTHKTSKNLPEEKKEKCEQFYLSVIFTICSKNPENCG